MVLKVIAPGTARTGASSLIQALEQLGFGECFNKNTVAAHPESIDTLHTAYNGGKVDWHSLFNEQYECVADFPASWFYEELMEAYPNAKIVLTVCDPDEWYIAARDTIRAFNPLMKTSFGGLGRCEKLCDMIWDWIFELNIDDKTKAIELYTKHLEAVKRAVPSNRLLIFDINHGWPPLCQFLQVPVPETKFPHADERISMLKMVEDLQKTDGVSLQLANI